MDLVVEPPTFLFIQMQLCQKASLKDWLASNVTNRQRETVINYFEQVLLLLPFMDKVLLLLLCKMYLVVNKDVRAIPTTGRGPK